MTRVARHRDGSLLLFDQADPDDDEVLYRLNVDMHKTMVKPLPCITVARSSTRYAVEINDYNGFVACAEGYCVPDSPSSHFLAHCSESLDGWAFVICHQKLLAIALIDGLGTATIREIADVPYTELSTQMALLIRGTIRELLLLNQFHRPAGNEDLRSVNIDTGLVRTIAPYSALVTLDDEVDPPVFEGLLVDSDPSRDTAYILFSEEKDTKISILAVSGLHGF